MGGAAVGLGEGSGVRGGDPLLLVGRTETYLSPGCGEVSGAVQEQVRGCVSLGLPPACPGPLRLKSCPQQRTPTSRPWSGEGYSIGLTRALPQGLRGHCRALCEAGGRCPMLGV